MTGSKTLLDVSGGRVLVDCGLFQGRRELRRQNWSPFPVRPGSVDAVLVTHAHVDHVGYVPRLVTQGFTGPVLVTEGTRRLAGIVLPDSGHLQEEEAAFANRRGYSKHDPALPLYTERDAIAALERLRTVPFDDAVDVVDGVRATFRRAGHILGAASIAVDVAGTDLRVVFSGDLGRAGHPLLPPPAPIGPADVVVVESTYGDEDHEPPAVDDVLADVIGEAAARGGVVVIPAFAVDRTEVVLWHLDQLVASGRVPDLPIFVDSPMANRALDVYEDQARSGSSELRAELHGRRLFPSIRLTSVTSVEESKALNARRGPFVVVSASGMATGGRVVHHLAHRIRDSRNAVVLVGFQAPGTRGDRLRSGARTIKMLGEYHPVRARVESLSLSAHADRDELLAWLATADPPPGMVYVNHGEPAASAALVEAIGAELGLPAAAPTQGERVLLRPRS